MNRDPMKIDNRLTCVRIRLLRTAIRIESVRRVEDCVGLQHLLGRGSELVKRHSQNVRAKTLAINRVREERGINAIPSNSGTGTNVPEKAHCRQLLIPDREGICGRIIPTRARIL